jgi:cytochrome c554/c'-like protein
MAWHVNMIKKRNYVILLLTMAVYGVNVCWVRQHTPQETLGYIGSAACQSCHKEIYDSHIKTAHYRTSRPAAREFIKGSFEPNRNRFSYNQHMEVVMERKNGRSFQTAFLNGIPFESESFDIVIGSGRKGQSYLYWDSNRLFQLPITYYTPLDRWCNSPGYPDNFAYFNKHVHGRCIECHGTYASVEEKEGVGTEFVRSSIIYGIDCERCHGPAADHVAYHSSHPGERTGKYIINARLMSRQQRLDACALCHAGFREALKPAFSFAVGDTLDNYSAPDYSTDSLPSLDVHGNQYGMLTSSKCFRMSAQMDCSSCHNVHRNEVNSPQLFSQRCMNCHQESTHNDCSLPAVRKQALYNNCIDCHMPALPSQKIMLQMSDTGQVVHLLVRTHRIGVYPEYSKDYLERIGLRYRPGKN